MHDLIANKTIAFFRLIMIWKLTYVYTVFITLYVTGIKSW